MPSRGLLDYIHAKLTYILLFLNNCFSTEYNIKTGKKLYKAIIGLYLV